MVKVGKMEWKDLVESIVTFSKEYIADPHKSFILNQVLSELETYVPRTVVAAKARLYHKELA